MKINNLIISEHGNSNDFYPFSIMHSVWEIRIGILRLFEKVQKAFNPDRLIFTGRKEHETSFLKREDLPENLPVRGNVLILDASLVVSLQVAKTIMDVINRFPGKNHSFFSQGHRIGIYYSELPEGSDLTDINIRNVTPFDFEMLEIETEKINYLHDAIFLNGSNIVQDIELLGLQNVNAELNYEGVYMLEKTNIYIGYNVNVLPGVVIDASHGPVVIGDNVTIMPQATIIGPCYIGDNSLIKVGAKIYEDTSIGKFCKVGGEVENSIFHSYSNKQHDGFLGHSYICEWVNLGADTNNSDLKNTYGNISLLIDEKEVDTGRMFMGLLCGDHTKSAINTSFTTGSVVGISAVLVYEGFHPRSIPSFSWGGRKDSPIFRPAKAIEIARKVMKRRGKELLPEEELLMKMEYDRIKNK